MRQLVLTIVHSKGKLCHQVDQLLQNLGVTATLFPCKHRSSNRSQSRLHLPPPIQHQPSKFHPVLSFHLHHFPTFQMALSSFRWIGTTSYCKLLRLPASFQCRRLSEILFFHNRVLLFLIRSLTQVVVIVSKTHESESANFQSADIPLC